MAESAVRADAGKPLRKISDPLVAAGPSGCRFRTRLHLSDTEAAALVEIGEFLGSCYRRELAGRIRLGRIDRDGHKQWRATRKQALTSVSDLHSAVDVLEKRCSLRPGELADDDGDSRRGKT